MRLTGTTCLENAYPVHWILAKGCGKAFIADNNMLDILNHGFRGTFMCKFSFLLSQCCCWLFKLFA